MSYELESFLVRHFGVDESSIIKSDLTEILKERIKFFIRTDLDKLMQILYKIDVNDKLTGQAFDLGDIDKVSLALSEAIINRQLQKIAYRNKGQVDEA